VEYIAFHCSFHRLMIMFENVSLSYVPQTTDAKTGKDRGFAIKHWMLGRSLSAQNQATVHILCFLSVTNQHQWVLSLLEAHRRDHRLPSLCIYWPAKYTDVSAKSKQETEHPQRTLETPDNKDFASMLIIHSVSECDQNASAGKSTLSSSRLQQTVIS
jgi:hypothetical protein